MLRICYAIEQCVPAEASPEDSGILRLSAYGLNLEFTLSGKETLGELDTRIPERPVSHSEADFAMD